MKKEITLYILRAVILLMAFSFAVRMGVDPVNFWAVSFGGVALIIAVVQYYTIRSLYKENNRLLKALSEIRSKK